MQEIRNSNCIVSYHDGEKAKLLETLRFFRNVNYFNYQGIIKNSYELKLKL